MTEKIVQRISVEVSSETDLVGLIDLIELELNLSTGQKRLRNRISEIAVNLGSAKTSATQEAIDGLLDAVSRLGRIEDYMRGYGFETARDTSKD